MKRQRGRNRNNNNRNNNNNHNRSLDSNGPDVKVRGTASTIYEKYTTLARDAASSGNRVKAESYRQHAEHYLRLMNAQEAAKQEAREKAEAERAARGETEGTDEEGDNRRNQRHHNNRRRQNQEKASETTTASEKDAPDGLEVVTPENDAPKAKRNAKPKKVDVSSDSDQPETEEVPKRRRRAPARKAPEEDTSVEAAE